MMKFPLKHMADGESVLVVTASYLVVETNLKDNEKANKMKTSFCLVVSENKREIHLGSKDFQLLSFFPAFTRLYI